MKTIDNEKKPSVNYSSTSTSSSDSGVIIIDNTTTINGKPVNAKNTSVGDKERRIARQPNDGFSRTEINDGANPSKINIQNFINITNAEGNEQGKRPLEATRFYGPQGTKSMPMSAAPKNSSPTSSQRSISITIDSSIVDSDSDFETDIEGEGDGEQELHNFTVRKVGEKTTLPANSPEIPNLNKGLTVIREKVTSDDIHGGPPLSNSLLKGGLNVPDGGLAPSTPQIGSIALTNSTDVTFGDKHFYEGPVTIQQFLIDSRDKWKSDDMDGQDNPIFAHDGHAQKSAANDLNVSRKMTSDPTHQPYKFKFNRKVFIVTGAIVVLTVLIGILFITIFKSTTRKSKLLGDGDDSRKNIPINSTIDSYDGALKLVPRDEWQARPPKSDLDKLKLPVHRVIISHTASDTCQDHEVCAYRLQVIQSFHMDSLKWDDIGYNFLIGADGKVYEGRGWDKQGAHTKGYNIDSIGISFIGTFSAVKPTEPQLNAAKLLMELGVQLGKLVPDFKLYGARQLGSTESPGNALYKIIKTWSHWSEFI